MAFAETAPLVALLKLDDKFSGPLKNAQRTLGQFDAKLDRTATRGFRAGQQIGTGIKNGLKIAAVGLGLLATQVVAGLNQLVQLEDQTAATNAALTSTKGVSGQTATSIRKLAEQYENLNAVIDDKVIQSGENVLLTFTRIHKEAFEPALAAALDLSVAMGEDLQSAIVQVGKALNDPAKGFTALRRVGIQFTDDQEQQIKALQKSGDLLGAQKIILQELGTEFGGRFAAQGRTAKGTIAGIGDAVEDLQKSLATALFPTVQKLLPRIRETLGSPQFAATVSKVGDAIAGLFSNANIEEGGRILTGLFNTAKSVAPAIQSAAQITGEVVKTAVGLFKSLPPEIQALAVAGLAVNKLTGGLVTNIAGGLISAVISSFRGMMNVNAGVVNVNGAVGGSGIPGAAAAGGSGIFAALIAPLASVLAVGITAKLQQDQVDQQANALKLQTIAFAKTASDAALAQSIDGVRKTLAGIGPGNPYNVKGQTTEVLNLLIAEMNQRIRGGHVINSAGGVGNTPYGPFSQAGINAQGGVNGGYGPWTDMTDALKSNTSALLKRTHTWTEYKSVIDADRVARGLHGGPGGISTSLQPRFNFLRQAQSGSKDAAVADAIAQGFERGATPLFRNTKLIPQSIKELERDQHQLLKAGDTKNAAIIGHDIARLKTELARRQAATTKAIRDKDLKVNVSVPVSVSQFINGRLIDAATHRFQSTIVGSRGAFREFG